MKSNLINENTPITNSNIKLLKEAFDKVERALCSDVITYYGNLDDGVENVIKDIIESLVSDKKKNDKLTVILTTNGGSLFCVERIVNIFRNFYKEVDYIVLDYAYSAGTVMCCSGDRIFMDYHSVLGPIDPQVKNKDGVYVAALGYLDKINELIEKAKNEELSSPEFMILKDFDLAELREYEQARDLAIDLLKNWLSKYKFKNWRQHTNGTVVTIKDKEFRAEEIANKLSDNKKWKSHGRPIDREKLEEMKLKIDRLEDNEKIYKIIVNYYNTLIDYILKYNIDIFVQTRRHI